MDASYDDKFIRSLDEHNLTLKVKLQTLFWLRFKYDKMG